jgi:hypothetical protein
MLLMGSYVRGTATSYSSMDLARFAATLPERTADR